MKGEIQPNKEISINFDEWWYNEIESNSHHVFLIAKWYGEYNEIYNSHQ